MRNKKVLLRERKRHTALRVAITGMPSLLHPGQGRGYSGQVMMGGVPRAGTDKQTETITFPHPTDAGDNNTLHVTSSQ